MPDVRPDVLRQLSFELLTAVGTPRSSAETVANSLVDANLAGHDSHGVLRLTGYLAGVNAQHVLPRNLPELISVSGATAIVDAHEGWGQPAMWLATEAALSKAQEFGLGAAVVRNSYHIGRVAPYVEWLTVGGMIGLAMSNAAPAVAPYGSRSRVLGTNPIAWAVPRANNVPPLSFDVATAGIAEGKLRVARAKGVTVPAGNVLTSGGEPTIDPNDFYAGGALLPFGGHKGSGFSLLAQIIGRGLAGMDPTSYDGPRGVNGPFILAIDIARFAPLDAFQQEVEAQSAAVANSQVANGFSEVLLPGQPELTTRAYREVHGVPIPDATWRELQDLAREYGLDTLQSQG